MNWNDIYQHKFELGISLVGAVGGFFLGRGRMSNIALSQETLKAIPLAAGVLYPGFILSPAVGAVLMSLSTVIVAINAQTLRNKFQK